ncbi:MAG: type sorting protein [Chitinophagaceae bacterium]|nr:type sorting protein [Chitinophagaceae bacterium]
MRIFTISFPFFLLVISSPVFGQTTVVLSAAKDNTIFQNYLQYSNGSGNEFAIGNNDSYQSRRSLIKFDVAASVPVGATITAVTLILNVAQNFRGPHDAKLYKLLTDWGEGTSTANGYAGQGNTATGNDATWNCAKAVAGGATCVTAWTAAGGDFSATLSANTTVDQGSPAWTGLQMVADVQSWLSSPSNNFGWTIIGDESIAYTPIFFASRENSTTAIQPQLSVTYTPAVPLPVTFTGVKVFSKNTGVQVEWTTQQEINIERYEVERSTDAQQFSKIGSVQANNRSVVNNYNLLDVNPYSGVNFYRIKIIDRASKVTYSEIVKVSVASSLSQVTISPNPVRGNTITLLLSNLQKGNYTIRLFDKLGRQLLSKVIEYDSGSVTESISLSKVMAPGAYQLKVTGNGNTLTRQVIKN